TQLMTRIQSIPQPVIAQVQGMATAAGCQLVATCDMAVASEQASFATPGVKIGLFCTTPMVALSRAIGRKRALQMLMTGDVVDAVTAADWGLINLVVPATELESSARKLATRIAAASSLTVALGKEAFYAQIDLDQPKAYAYAKEVMSMNALAADAQEGISAFLGKRPRCSTRTSRFPRGMRPHCSLHMRQARKFFWLPVVGTIMRCLSRANSGFPSGSSAPMALSSARAKERRFISTACPACQPSN